MSELDVSSSVCSTEPIQCGHDPTGAVPCLSPTPQPCVTSPVTVEELQNLGQSTKRQKSKGKLVRSLAVCDESLLNAEDTQEDGKVSKKEIEKEPKNKIKPPSLTQECNQEYTDSTGIDLHNFLLNTLQSNPSNLCMMQSKGKLVRSLAVCDESLLNAEDTQEDGKVSKKEIEKEPKNKIKPPSLTQECNQEYTDSTGIDLHNFLLNTLQSNPRDRMMLLKLEQEMIDFINDSSSLFKKFPQMSSYHRMLVHRVAAYFGMEHNVDQTGKAIIINKTNSTRIPEQDFGELVRDKSADAQKRFILKRESCSLENEDAQRHRTHPLREERRSKSMEEREKEYLKARERIFAPNALYSPAQVYIETKPVEDDELHSDMQRKRQLFRDNRNGSGRTSRQSSTDTESHWSDLRPWSSTDSDSSNRGQRHKMSKTASFSGVTARSQRESDTRLYKTGSESSSSGGSSCSLSRSHLSQGFTHLVAPPSNCGDCAESPALPNTVSYILLSMEGAALPPGGILLNPPTGQPFVNPDGSPAIYNLPTGQQPIRGQIVHPPQPITNHMAPQSLQQPYSYPSHHLRPVSACQQLTVHEDLQSQFNHMRLNRPSSGEAHDSSHSGHAPATHITGSVYTPGFMVAPAGFGSQTGCSQQDSSQVPLYYMSPSQCPTSTNSSLHTPTPVPYSSQHNHTTAHAGDQHQGSTNQQPVMVPYTPYQVSVGHSTALPQRVYQPPLVLPAHMAETNPLYCTSMCVLGTTCPSGSVPLAQPTCSTNNTDWQLKY